MFIWFLDFEDFCHTCLLRGCTNLHSYQRYKEIRFLTSSPGFVLVELTTKKGRKNSLTGRHSLGMPGASETNWGQDRRWVSLLRIGHRLVQTSETTHIPCKRILKRLILATVVSLQLWRQAPQQVILTRASDVSLPSDNFWMYEAKFLTYLARYIRICGKDSQKFL